MITEVNACVQAINPVANAIKNSKKPDDIQYEFDMVREGTTGQIVLNVANNGDEAIKVEVALEDGYKLTNPKLIASKGNVEINIARLRYNYTGGSLTDDNLYSRKDQKVIIKADDIVYETGESIEEIFDRIK